MSLNNTFPLKHGETVPPSALSGWWLAQIMAQRQAENGARVVNLHQKIPASPLAEHGNRWPI